MPRFKCDYRSDGILRTATITASSAAEAARKMQSLNWAPGAGSCSNPRLSIALSELLRPAIVALSLAAGIVLTTAANDDAPAQIETALR